MSIQKLKETAEKVLNRLDAVSNRGEEATKQALVLPMIEALGYDIWHPSEVCPEYEADFAIKKAGQKEKVDYAIFINNVPRIYIEVKQYKVDLNGHQGQLARYFNATPTVSLGIITNGTEYRLYTDTVAQNVMDNDPFHVVNLESPDQGLEIFATFQKSLFSPESTRNFASELNYTAKVVNLLRSELDLRDGEPSDEFVKWVLTAPDMFDGRVTSTVLQRFRPIVKSSLQRVIKEIVRRSVAAMDDGVSAKMPTTEPAQMTATEIPDFIIGVEEGEGARKVITTERELACYNLIKQMLQESPLAGSIIYDPSLKKNVPIELGFKDTTAYFGIYLNKPNWWVIRLHIETKKPWIGFELDEEAVKPFLPLGHEIMEATTMCKVRISFNSVEDLHHLKDIILMAFKSSIFQLQQGSQGVQIIQSATQQPSMN